MNPLIFYRYKVFSRNRVQRPQSDDEEFDDTSNVTVQDLEQIELTTQSSTQTTSRTYAVVGRRTTSTTTLATPTTSTILTDITNESQTTLSYNDNSNTPTTTTSTSKTTSPIIQDIPSLLEISLSQDFDHSTHKPIVLSTTESGLDTQEVTATTTEYNSIDDNNNNNISNSNQNTDTEEVTVEKTEVDKSNVDLKVDNNDNIKKNVDISSNSSPLKNNVDSSSTSTTTTSIPETIMIDRNNGDSVKKHFNIASELLKSTTTITSIETSSQSPTNNEFLGTVSSPRPFGFPRRRTRPTITTTATPDNSSQSSLNSEQNFPSSLDKINRSNDNKKLATKKVSSSLRNNTENTIVSESSSTSAPKLVDGSIFNRSNDRKFSSVGNGIGKIPKTNSIQDFSPKNSIVMSRAHPDYEIIGSEEEDYHDDQLSKQYNWKDNRVPLIKWKQVPLDSSDVSSYKAYKHILNKDFRIIRGNQFENILDDKDEIKTIQKRSTDTQSVKNPSWKDGRNSKIKWKQSSLDSSDISNLKSYRHYLNEDKEYQRKHVEQQKQDQESLKRLSRSIDMEVELSKYETVNRRKLMSFDENDDATPNNENENLAQSINEMIEATDRESSSEEEDFRPLTSFKKSPYQYKYALNSNDKKKQDDNASIKYKYRGNLNSGNKSGTNEEPFFNITFNDSPKTSHHFSKQNTEKEKPIKKDRFGFNSFEQQSSAKEPQISTSTTSQYEKEFLLDLPTSEGNISKNNTTSNTHMDEKSTIERIESTTKANRKYQFSFNSNQTASRGSYSYEENKDRTQQFSKPEISTTKTSNDLVRNEIKTEESTTINPDLVDSFIESTTPNAADPNNDSDPFITSTTHTSLSDNAISSSTEYIRPTTYRGDLNYIISSSKPRRIQSYESTSTPRPHQGFIEESYTTVKRVVGRRPTTEAPLLKSLENLNDLSNLSQTSKPDTPKSPSHSYESRLPPSQNQRILEDSITTAKRVIVRRPTIKTPQLNVDEDIDDQLKLSSTKKPETTSWKSKSRGTFRPKIEDFSSLLSHDNDRQKNISTDLNDKAVRRRRPMKGNDNGERNTIVETKPKSTKTQQDYTHLPLRGKASRKNPTSATTSTERYFRTTQTDIHLENATREPKEDRRSDDKATVKMEEPQLESSPFANDQVLINRVFGSSNDHKESNTILTEIPLFTRRKYYKYLKDSPTIYVSKSENNDDNKISDSNYRIKEVFDTSFDSTTPIPLSNKLRTSKKSSENLDFFIEPEQNSEQKSSYSSKVKISLIPSDNLVIDVSTKPSLRKSKSAKISTDDQDFSVESKRETITKDISDLEDMITERSSYYDIPENIDSTTISNEDEGFISANEVNGLMDLNTEDNIKNSEVPETENLFIEMNNLLSEGALIETVSIEPEIIETDNELKQQGILRYKNINNLGRIRSTTPTSITSAEKLLQADVRQRTRSTTTTETPEIETTPYLGLATLLPRVKSPSSSIELASTESLEFPNSIENQESFTTEGVTEVYADISKEVGHIDLITPTNNIKLEELDSVTELVEATQYPDIVERSQTVSSDILLEGSTTEILRTRFPVRNRPTIGSRATTSVVQVTETSTEKLDPATYEPKKGRFPLKRRKPSIEKTNTNTRITFGNGANSTSSNTANESTLENGSSSTERIVQPSRRPGSPLFRNRIRSTPRTTTTVETNQIPAEVDVRNTTIKSTLSGSKNRPTINRFKTTSRPRPTASPNENDTVEEVSPSSTTKKFLISRKRPAFNAKFKTSATTTTSTEGLTLDNKANEKEETDSLQELSTTTRRSTIRLGLNRLRSTSTTPSTKSTAEEYFYDNDTNKEEENDTSQEPSSTTRRPLRLGLNRISPKLTSTTESDKDVVNENTTETNEKFTLSTRRNSVLFRRGPGVNVFQTTNLPQAKTNVSKSVSKNDQIQSQEIVKNTSIFNNRRRPLNPFKSTTTTSPDLYKDEDELKQEEDDNSVEEDVITNVKSPLPFNKIKVSKPVSANSDSKSEDYDVSEENDGVQNDGRYQNIIRGSQKYITTNDESLPSTTKKYIQIHRNRSKINSRFPGSTVENSETENEIEPINTSRDNEHLQPTTKKYSPLTRSRGSAKPTDATIVLGENGYPLGYKPIGRSKAKYIITNSSETALDINDTLNTSTNIDIAHSDTSLELNDNNNSNTSYLNKNSNQRFQNKFTRTRTLGSTINKTTTPTPTQVNNELDSENTSTPSSSHRYRAIKIRRPINHNTLINELNNDTSTSTTITQSEDRERNSNTSIIEAVDKAGDNTEDNDSEVHDTLQVSELRRPFEPPVERFGEVQSHQENNLSIDSSLSKTLEDVDNVQDSLERSVNVLLNENSGNDSIDIKVISSSESVNNIKLETTSETIPESETAESNDESHTEISELPSKKKPFLVKKASINKKSNINENQDNIEEHQLQSTTERQHRPFFPKRFPIAKPVLDESVSESIVASEEPLVEHPTSRFRRPFVGKQIAGTASPRTSAESSSEGIEEIKVTKSEAVNTRARRPFFLNKKITTPASIDIKFIDEDEIKKEFRENEKAELEVTTSRFRKPLIGSRRTSTTSKLPLKQVESNEEGSSLEPSEVSTRRSFLLARKVTSTTQTSVEDESIKSNEPERTPTRKSFRSPGLSLKLSTESSVQAELDEDEEKISVSTQRSRFALGGRKSFGSTRPTESSSQSTSTTEENTSRQPRIFERKFGRTRTSPSSDISTGVNNAGVGFIDLKTLALATRGRSTAINRFKSTTARPDDDDISEEHDDEDEESNEIINHRPSVKPSAFVRPTIKANLFANRNQPNTRRPFQSLPKNEDDSGSDESGSEEEDDGENQRQFVQKPASFQRPLSRPNVVPLRNVGKRIQTIRKPQTIESEEENVSEENDENNDDEGSRLSNFNSKIYENVNSPSTPPTVTKPTRRTVNNPYAAINRLRANVNNTTPLTRPKPSSRPRVVNRPLFSSSTQSSENQEQSTQNTNSNTRTFKRKFGKFTTTAPSIQTANKDEISVDALNISNKQIYELTSIKQSTSTVKPTQSKTSATVTENTEPTEDYDSTTIIATTIPDGTEDHTEMDEILIPFQDDSLLKLDSVDTTTTSNEEETTLIDENLTQFQENISPITKGPVTTSTEKATTLKHVFAIAFDERAEITTEIIDASTDSRTVAEKTQEIEDEVKKIINMLTATDAIKPVTYEEVLKETVKDVDVTTEKTKEPEAVFSTEKNVEIERLVQAKKEDEKKEIVQTENKIEKEVNDQKDIDELGKVIEEKHEENVLEKTFKVLDEEEFKNKEPGISNDEIKESSTEKFEIVSEDNTHTILKEINTIPENIKNDELHSQEPELDSEDKIGNITTDKNVDNNVSVENSMPSSTESNLIKIVTGQTIIFFDDYDEVNQFKDSEVPKQQERPIVENINTTDDIGKEVEPKSTLIPNNKFFTGKKFFPSHRSQESKSISNTKTISESEGAKSLQEKPKLIIEEKRSFSIKNKFPTKERNFIRYNDQTTEKLISDSSIHEDNNDEVEGNESIINNGNKEIVSSPVEKQEVMLTNMIQEIKEVEMRSQEKMDYDNISDEEKKRLTAEKLVEINKIVEVYLKEEKVRFNPRTMEIIRLGDGELKLVRPARTYKLGEISRIKHVSNVQIEGHSSVSGTTLSPPSYKQARNVRVASSEPIRNALPSENTRHGKVFVVPEIVKQMETSTISLEGLFYLNKHGKDLNTVYEPEPEMQATTTTEKNSIPIKYVRPVSLESDPLVISIANLDQVVLSKLQRDRQ